MINKKVLILFAHPSQHRSEVNAPLFKAANTVEGVTCVDLYAEYPHFNINIDREQQRLRDHDVVIFQFPLYWYSTPSIMKEYQDLVLEYGFAYGSEGRALEGKYFLTATTTGGPKEAYTLEGYQHFPLRQLLAPLEQTATLCHMTYLPPFVLFAAGHAKAEGRLDEHVKKYVRLLEALRDDRYDLHKALTMKTVCFQSDDLIIGGQ